MNKIKKIIQEQIWVDTRLLPEISTLKEKLKIQDRNTALKDLDDGYVYPKGMYTVAEAMVDLTEMEKEQPTPDKRRMMRLPYTWNPKDKEGNTMQNPKMDLEKIKKFLTILDPEIKEWNFIAKEAE